MQETKKRVLKKREGKTYRTSARLIESRYVLTDGGETIGVSLQGEGIIIYKGDTFKDVLMVSENRKGLMNLGKLIGWAALCGTDEFVKTPNFTPALSAKAKRKYTKRAKTETTPEVKA